MTDYVIDSPEKWAEVVWRIGAGALRLHIEGRTRLTGEEAAKLGLTDEIPPAGDRRSAIAAASAAMLVQARGGDALERAEFARLFAIGEPQEGLRAFLEKRKPAFGMSVAEKA